MSRPREFDETQALDQALEQFWSGSYGATSTQDLCASTGLSKSSLYNTFESKAALYRRSLARYGEVKDGERQSYLDRAGTGRELVAALLTDVLTDQRDDQGRRSCLVVNALVEVGDSDEGVAELARSNLVAMGGLLAELIARGQADGSITASTPAAELADVVHATLNGLQVAGRLNRCPQDGPRAVGTLMSLLSAE